MKCRIGFNINFDLLQNSKGKKKENGRKDKERKQRNYKIQTQVKQITEFRIRFKTMF